MYHMLIASIYDNINNFIFIDNIVYSFMANTYENHIKMMQFLLIKEKEHDKCV